MVTKPNAPEPAPNWPIPPQIRPQIVQSDTEIQALIESLRKMDQTATQICENIEKNPRFYVKRKQQIGSDVLTDKLTDLKAAFRKEVSIPLQQLMERDGSVPSSVILEITRVGSHTKEMLSDLKNKPMVTTMGMKRKSSYYGSNRVENLCTDIAELLANFDIQCPQLRAPVCGEIGRAHV